MEERADDGLVRKLGLFALTNIVIANMIGSGIFTTSGLLMTDVRDPSMMIALWVVGGLIALCGAFCYGELGAAMPRAGGEYVFLSRLFHPLLGFLSGWVSFFVGFSAPIAASALGFSEYLTRAFPALLRWGVFEPGLEAAILRKLFAVLVILLFTLVHLRGIVFGAAVQNGLTLLKVGVILLLLAMGFALGTGDRGHFSQGTAFTFDFAGWKTVGLSLMWISFAYSGWNASAYIGSEVRSPSRNLPLSLIVGTGVVTVLYVALNVFYVYAVPPADMAGVVSIGGLAAGRLFGGSFETFFSLLIAFSLFSSLSAFIILGPRVYYAMARQGHFFRFAAELHPVHGVPSKSIVLQCAIAIVIVVSGRLEQIFTYMGFALGIFPVLSVIGLFRLRRSGGDHPRLPGFPITAIVYVLMGVSVLILGFLRSPIPASIAVATVLAGVPAYLLLARRNRLQGGTGATRLSRAPRDG